MTGGATTAPLPPNTTLTSSGLVVPTKPTLTTDVSAFGDAARFFGDTPTLGLEPEQRDETAARRLLPGDMLVLTTSSQQAETLAAAARGGKLASAGRRSCREWLEAFRGLLSTTDANLRPAALVVVRRTR